MKKREYVLIAIIALLAIIIIGLVSFSGNQENIILPGTSSECNWEKLNQDLLIWFKTEDRSGGFIVPKDIRYSEVEFKKISVLASVPTFDANIHLNGVKCSTLRPRQGEETNVLYDITDSCLNELREGINSFSTTTTKAGSNKTGETWDHTFDSRSIIEFQVEMMIKPANCLLN